MTERIHSNKKIKVSHIGKNYYELEVGSEVVLLERSEARELIGLIDNIVTFHTPDVSNYEDISDNYQ